MTRMILLTLTATLASSLTLAAQDMKDPPKEYTNSIGMKFVWIRPGSFMMGSPKEEKKRVNDETQHKVTLTRGFYMGVYTVTQEQWREVMGNNPSFFKGEKNLPVDTVSWNDCQEFIKKLREKDKEKKAYRLPTEAEWEYACRAGTTTPFHFGETISTEQANYNGNGVYDGGKQGVYRGKTTPVGSFLPNAWGLYDMHGNIMQWCQDRDGRYSEKEVTDPQGPEKGEHRVQRGSSCNDGPAFCRSAYRRCDMPGIRTDRDGLRVCFSLHRDEVPPKKEQPPEPKKAPDKQAKDTSKEYTNSVGMKFVWIPPGTFMMGSPKEEKQRELLHGLFPSDETQHKVTLTKGFWMGVYPVTQEQWEQVMGSNNFSMFKGEKNLPVDSVSWNACQEFIKKLREKDKDKKAYRLPTEAEWEYACRAGTKTPFHFGETISTDQANYIGSSGYGKGKEGVFRKKTTPVDSFPANPWGLHDMHGNVYQWCQDWYGNYPQKDVIDPQGPEKGKARVARGGCWQDYVWFCRSAFRYYLPPDLSSRTGFRVCFSVETDDPAPKKTETPKEGTKNETPQPKDPPKEFTNSLGMKFVWIKPGSFMMGSPKEEKKRLDRETQHKVTLTRGFYMGVYLVTQEQWQEVMGNNPSQFKSEKNLPVDSVSWDDCQEFINKLREKDTKAYRLPTEAEWEYACRAGTTTPFHFGETISTDQANYCGSFVYGNGKMGPCRLKTTPVGTFPANAWGLHDMHGNLRQWCQDWYAAYPNEDVVDPTGPKKDVGRVLRGGSCQDEPQYCRSAFRNANSPDFRTMLYGLRVCFSLEDFTNSFGMKFVWIPPGSFMMGSPNEEKERQANETQHKVTLTKGFYMGVNTVTQEQWQEVMGSNNSFFKGDKNLPVDSVSWDDCQEFIKKLRAKDKKPYRLPTEAEWEYSCRAETKTPFHFGETISTDQANYNGNFIYGDGKKGEYRAKTTPVGTFPANAWKLHDMHGNVWQWCQDWLGDYPHNDVTDPQGPETGKLRVIRGGSWYSPPGRFRSAFRIGDEPSDRDSHHGHGLRICFFVE